MLNLEDEFANRMKADATLMAILTGGVYTDTELGIEGLRRDADSPSSDAFDGDGLLLPTAVVRQLAPVPYTAIRDEQEATVAMSTVVEVYFYQYRDRDQVEAAMQRTFIVMEGKRIGKTYPGAYIGESTFFYDSGPVANSNVIRQDWEYTWIRRPEAL